MEEVLMKFVNEEGKTITKGVPKSLVSNYAAIGWQLVKNEKPAKEEKVFKDFQFAKNTKINE